MAKILETPQNDPMYGSREEPGKNMLIETPTPIKIGISNVIDNDDGTAAQVVFSYLPGNALPYAVCELEPYNEAEHGRYSDEFLRLLQENNFDITAEVVLEIIGLRVTKLIVEG